MTQACLGTGERPLDPQTVTLIVNTAAASPRCRARIEALTARTLPGCTVEHTKAPGDVERLAYAARARGARRVVVAGGDGTVHEAANALFESNVELAVVPAGSGNDFIRTLGVPRDLDAALTCAATGRVRLIDVIAITCRDLDGAERSRVCVNIAEAGIGGEVVGLAARARRLVGRTLAYHAALAVRLFTCRPACVDLTIDGIDAGTRRVNNLIVANGQYFGSGMHPMPRAQIDDGRLDVARIRDLGIAGLVRNSPLVQRGLPLTHPNIDQWTAREITAVSTSQVLLEADGELLGALPATFRIVPGALHVVTP